MADLFDDQHRFTDDIWGKVVLNELERDVIDTPEFQRLFRTSQLGFVDFAYQTANHTRGAHSIGACSVARELMACLERNMLRVRNRGADEPSVMLARAEQVLIRLGALLHDISHVPLSHDVERKTHKIDYPDDRQVKLKSCYGQYDKHDDFIRNPLLYLIICDRAKSVLARLLARYSRDFAQLIVKKPPPHLESFASLLQDPETRRAWPRLDHELLPQLLFHLLTYESQDEAEEPLRTIAFSYEADGWEVMRMQWGLGPSSADPALRRRLHELWYQPFRHDIVGNTLCADLLDYLKRDPQRLGMDRHLDLNLLNFYVLKQAGRHAHQMEGRERDNSTPERFSCAIDLYDTKRRSVRTELLNDVFRLLDLRHEIHEKAVMHRVVQSANAMLARALRLLGRNLIPSPRDLVGVGEEEHALFGEDRFFAELLARTRSGTEAQSSVSGEAENIQKARRILLKLIERRVYRPLVMLPGDQADAWICSRPDKVDRELRLRTLAAVIDSQRYSAFLLFVSGCVEKLLLGVIDDVDALWRYCAWVTSDPTRQYAAMQVVPSRAVIWTTPFKQLYKSPALVVAIRDTICQAHELTRPEHIKHLTKLHQTTAAERVRQLVDDAEGKYAAIWKLYVFLSDGLFYTGTLSKIAASSSPQQTVDAHKARLEQAKILFITAMRCAFLDWDDYVKKSSGDGKSLAEAMNSAPAGDDFAHLLGQWKPEFHKWLHYRTEHESYVDTMHMGDYAHDDFCLDGNACGRKCRDVRYKFDNLVTEAWRMSSEGANPKNREAAEFLESCGVNLDKLTNLEFTELAAQFWTNRSVISGIPPRDEKGRARSLYRLLWEDGLPWPDAGVISPVEAGSQETQTADPEDDDLPQNDREFAPWLKKKAEPLPPDSQKQLLQNIDRISEFLQERQSNRIAILRDLRERIANTAQLLAAGVTADEVMDILKRRWPPDSAKSS